MWGAGAVMADPKNQNYIAIPFICHLWERSGVPLRKNVTNGRRTNDEGAFNIDTYSLKELQPLFLWFKVPNFIPPFFSLVFFVLMFFLLLFLLGLYLFFFLDLLKLLGMDISNMADHVVGVKVPSFGAWFPPAQYWATPCDKASYFAVFFFKFLKITPNL